MLLSLVSYDSKLKVEIIHRSMTSSPRKFACMFRIKFPTKRIFRIFPILRTDGMALFCNLFMEWPSYLVVYSFNFTRNWMYLCDSCTSGWQGKHCQRVYTDPRMCKYSLWLMSGSSSFLSLQITHITADAFLLKFASFTDLLTLLQIFLWLPF